MCGAVERGPERGFTLLEVMVAVIILALGVASVTSFMIGLLRAGAFAGDVSTATALGEAKIEQVLEGEFHEIASGTDAVGRFTRTWTVSTNLAMKEIAVTVSWTDVGGRARQVALKSGLAP